MLVRSWNLRLRNVKTKVTQIHFSSFRYFQWPFVEPRITIFQKNNMPTQILSNRRVSPGGGWNANWDSINASIPALNNKTIVDLDGTYAFQDFNLCLLSSAGKIFLASRNSNQVWSSNLIDIETIPAIGNIGPFKDLACASNNDRGLFICAVTQDGRIVVIFRYWPNTWQKITLNVE